MAPGSRPPLTSRIRASFDGKRTKSEISSPVATNGFITTQDPESLRNAIDEAINSDTFQKAIAANLAKLIKPSIKSALDTIQPVVEAVYSHEILLRKLNQSVEDILDRLDEKGTVSRRESVVEPLGPEPDDGVPMTPVRGVDDGGERTPTQETPRKKAVSSAGPNLAEHRQLLEEYHAKTTSELARVSSAVDSNNAKVAEAIQNISDVDAKLQRAGEGIEVLRSAAEQSTTTRAVLQAQLDQVKDDIGEIITSIGTDLGKNVQALGQQNGAPDTSLFDSHTTKLDSMSADLVALKGRADIAEKVESISSEIASLKASIEAGNASNGESFTKVETQIGSVLTTLGGHTTALTEINEKAPHPDIISALQQSNDSHASHSASLDEIKSRAPTTVAVASGEGDNTGTTTALVDLKSELASLKEIVEAGVTSHNENVTGVGAKLDTVIATVEAHRASDSSAHILTAVQLGNEKHESHSAVLEELKSREMPSAATVDTSELTTKIDAISELMQTHGTSLDDIKSSHQQSIDSHASHTAVLEELKSREVAPAASLDTSELTAKIDSISDAVNTHTTTLDEIKAAHLQSTESHTSHTAALEELKSREIAPAPAADTSDLATKLSTISEGIDSHSAILEEIKSANLQSNVSHSSHATILEELKSREIPSATTLDNSEITAQLGTMTSTLDSHTSAFEELKASQAQAVKAHAAALEATRATDSAPADTAVAEAVDLAPLEAQITSIADKLDEHSEALADIKGHTVSHITALEGHGTSLNEIKALAAKEVPSVDNSSLDAKVDAIANTLETHTSTLEEIKTIGSTHVTTLDSHRTILEEVKTLGSRDLPATTDNSALEAQVATLASTLGSHTSALDEIKAHGSAHTAALEGHGSALEGLRSLDSAPVPATEAVDLSGLEGHIAVVIATLESHSAALDELKAASGAHAEALQQTRSVDNDVPTTNADTAALESHINSIVETLQAHSASLDEISNANQSHTSKLGEIEAHGHSYTTVLDEIKTATASHASALDDIRSPGLPPPMPSINSTSLAGLEIQIGSIISTLSVQTEAIKDLRPQAELSSESKEVIPASSSEGDHNEGLTNVMASIVDTLEMHTSLLNEIKEDVAAEILTTIHELGERQANQNYLLNEIREADLSDEVLTLLHASGESHQNHTAALEKLEAALQASNESHAAHAGSLEEIKSRSIDSPAVASSSVDMSGVEAKIDGLTSVLEEHRSTLEVIKSSTTATHDMHAGHALALGELKARSVEPVAVDISGVETKIDSVISALEEHKAALAEIKDTSTASHDLHTTSVSSLDEIKARSVEPTLVPTIDLSGLEAQLATVTANLEEHKSLLAELKELHASHGDALDEIQSKPIDVPAQTVDLSSLEGQLADIAAALSRVNEFHAAHSVSLDEINARSIESSPIAGIDLSGLEAQLDNITNALDDHKASLAEVKDLHTAHAASLDELKDRSADIAPPPAVDFSGLETQLTTINATLAEHMTVLTDVKTTASASHDLHTAHATSLEDIKARSLEPVSTAPAIDISGLEEQMGSIHSSIEEIKTKSLEPATSMSPVDLSGLETQLAGLTTMLEEHKATLSEVQSTSLASHELHTAHASSLDEIKSRSIEPTDAAALVIAGLSTHLDTISGSLDEHKTILSKIDEATATSNTSHAAHTAALDEIRESSLVSTASHSAHTQALSEIKDATASWNEAHSANAFVLSEIKEAATASNESHTSHTHALSELGVAAARANGSLERFAESMSLPSSGTRPEDYLEKFGATEGHLTSIISTLGGHGLALGRIEEGVLRANPEVLASIKDSRDLLTSHTALLSDISATSSNNEVLDSISSLKTTIADSHAEHDTNLKTLGTTTKESHSHIAETLGALTLASAAGAGATALLTSTYDSQADNDQVLTEVRSLNTTLTSVAAQIDINHTTITTSLSTLSDELKAEIDASGTHVSDQLHTLTLPTPTSTSNTQDLTTLEEGMKGVEGKIGNLEASIKQTGSFVVGLYEGVHLNDMGVEQLQEQLVMLNVRNSDTVSGSATPVGAISRGIEAPADTGMGASRERGLGSEDGGSDRQRERSLSVPDEAVWFQKRGRRKTNPSPLREVTTVSPPVSPPADREVDVQGRDGDRDGGEEVEEYEQVDEEEMPSIDKVLAGVVGGVAVAGLGALAARELGDEEEEGVPAQGEVVVPGVEGGGDARQDVVGDDKEEQITANTPQIEAKEEVGDPSITEPDQEKELVLDEAETSTNPTIGETETKEIDTIEHVETTADPVEPEDNRADDPALEIAEATAVPAVEGEQDTKDIDNIKDAKSTGPVKAEDTSQTEDPIPEGTKATDVSIEQGEQETKDIDIAEDVDPANLVVVKDTPAGNPVPETQEVIAFLDSKEQPVEAADMSEEIEDTAQEEPEDHPVKAMSKEIAEDDAVLAAIDDLQETEVIEEDVGVDSPNLVAHAVQNTEDLPVDGVEIGVGPDVEKEEQTNDITPESTSKDVENDGTELAASESGIVETIAEEATEASIARDVEASKVIEESKEIDDDEATIPVEMEVAYTEDSPVLDAESSAASEAQDAADLQVDESEASIVPGIEGEEPAKEIAEGLPLENAGDSVAPGIEAENPAAEAAEDLPGEDIEDSVVPDVEAEEQAKDVTEDPIVENVDQAEPTPVDSENYHVEDRPLEAVEAIITPDVGEADNIEEVRDLEGPEAPTPSEPEIAHEDDSTQAHIEAVKVLDVEDNEGSIEPEAETVDKEISEVAVPDVDDSPDVEHEVGTKDAVEGIDNVENVENVTPEDSAPEITQAEAVTDVQGHDEDVVKESAVQESVVADDIDDSSDNKDREKAIDNEGVDEPVESLEVDAVKTIDAAPDTDEVIEDAAPLESEAVRDHIQGSEVLAADAILDVVEHTDTKDIEEPAAVGAEALGESDSPQAFEESLAVVVVAEQEAKDKDEPIPTDPHVTHAEAAEESVIPETDFQAESQGVEVPTVAEAGALEGSSSADAPEQSTSAAPEDDDEIKDSKEPLTMDSSDDMQGEVVSEDSDDKGLPDVEDQQKPKVVDDADLTEPATPHDDQSDEATAPDNSAVVDVEVVMEKESTAEPNETEPETLPAEPPSDEVVDNANASLVTEVDDQQEPEKIEDPDPTETETLHEDHTATTTTPEDDVVADTEEPMEPRELEESDPTDPETLTAGNTTDEVADAASESIVPEVDSQQASKETDDEIPAEPDILHGDENVVTVPKDSVKINVEEPLEIKGIDESNTAETVALPTEDPADGSVGNMDGSSAPEIEDPQDLQHVDEGRPAEPETIQEVIPVDNAKEADPSVEIDESKSNAQEEAPDSAVPDLATTTTTDQEASSDVENDITIETAPLLQEDASTSDILPESGESEMTKEVDDAAPEQEEAAQPADVDEVVTEPDAASATAPESLEIIPSEDKDDNGDGEEPGVAEINVTEESPALETPHGSPASVVAEHNDDVKELIPVLDENDALHERASEEPQDTTASGEVDASEPEVLADETSPIEITESDIAKDIDLEANSAPEATETIHEPAEAKESAIDRNDHSQTDTEIKLPNTDQGETFPSSPAVSVGLDVEPAVTEQEQEADDTDGSAPPVNSKVQAGEPAESDALAGKPDVDVQGTEALDAAEAITLPESDTLAIYDENVEAVESAAEVNLGIPSQSQEDGSIEAAEDAHSPIQDSETEAITDLAVQAESEGDSAVIISENPIEVERTVDTADLESSEAVTDTMVVEDDVTFAPPNAVSDEDGNTGHEEEVEKHALVENEEVLDEATTAHEPSLVQDLIVDDLSIAEQPAFVEADSTPDLSDVVRESAEADDIQKDDSADVDEVASAIEPETVDDPNLPETSVKEVEHDDDAALIERSVSGDEEPTVEEDAVTTDQDHAGDHTLANTTEALDASTLAGSDVADATEPQSETVRSENLDQALGDNAQLEEKPAAPNDDHDIIDDADTKLVIEHDTVEPNASVSEDTQPEVGSEAVQELSSHGDTEQITEIPIPDANENGEIITLTEDPASDETEVEHAMDVIPVDSDAAEHILPTDDEPLATGDTGLPNVDDSQATAAPKDASEIDDVDIEEEVETPDAAPIAVDPKEDGEIKVKDHSEVINDIEVDTEDKDEDIEAVSSAVGRTDDAEASHAEAADNEAQLDPTSDDTTELDEESPRDPDPTPINQPGNVADHDDSALLEYLDTSAQYDHGDLSTIDKMTHDENSFIAPDSRAEVSSSPFIEDPNLLPVIQETQHEDVSYILPEAQLASSPFIEEPSSLPIVPQPLSFDPHNTEYSAPPIDNTYQSVNPEHAHTTTARDLPDEDDIIAYYDQDTQATTTAHNRAQPPSHIPISSNVNPYPRQHPNSTPLESGDANPFEDSDNILSPSDAFTPFSARTPYDEVEEPVMPHTGLMNVAESMDNDSEDEGVTIRRSPLGMLPIYGGTYLARGLENESEYSDDADDDDWDNAPSHPVTVSHGWIPIVGQHPAPMARRPIDDNDDDNYNPESEIRPVESSPSRAIPVDNRMPLGRQISDQSDYGGFGGESNWMAGPGRRNTSPRFEQASPLTNRQPVDESDEDYDSEAENRTSQPTSNLRGIPFTESNPYHAGQPMVSRGYDDDSYANATPATSTVFAPEPSILEERSTPTPRQFIVDSDSDEDYDSETENRMAAPVSNLRGPSPTDNNSYRTASPLMSRDLGHANYGDSAPTALFTPPQHDPISHAQEHLPRTVRPPVNDSDEDYDSEAENRMSVPFSHPAGAIAADSNPYHPGNPLMGRDLRDDSHGRFTPTALFSPAQHGPMSHAGERQSSIVRHPVDSSDDDYDDGEVDDWPLEPVVPARAQTITPYTAQYASEDLYQPEQDRAHNIEDDYRSAQATASTYTDVYRQVSDEPPRAIDPYTQSRGEPYDSDEDYEYQRPVAARRFDSAAPGDLASMRASQYVDSDDDDEPELRSLQQPSIPRISQQAPVETRQGWEDSDDDEQPGLRLPQRESLPRIQQNAPAATHQTWDNSDEDELIRRTASRTRDTPSIAQHQASSSPTQWPLTANERHSVDSEDEVAEEDRRPSERKDTLVRSRDPVGHSEDEDSDHGAGSMYPLRSTGAHNEPRPTQHHHEESDGEDDEGSENAQHDARSARQIQPKNGNDDDAHGSSPAFSGGFA